MNRFLFRLSLITGGVFLLACLGQAVPFQLVFFLAVGWIRYLYRVLPQVRVDGAAAVTAGFCLVLLTVGTHRFASWLYSQVVDPADEGLSSGMRWQRRWTAWLIAGFLLMFIAGLSSVGVAHQVGWLLTSNSFVDAGGGASAAARRAQSVNNLKQIGLALHNYRNEKGSFPPGGNFDRRGRPMHGWQAMILPYLEHQDVHDQIDFAVPWNDPRNVAPYQTQILGYLRPGIEREKNAAGYALSHYAANARVLGGDDTAARRTIADGEACTIMAGEVASNFKPWGDPTNWRDPALGINQNPAGFGSPAPGGANLLFVDGSVRFVTDKIAPHVLKALSTPAGGETLHPDEY